MSWKLLHAIVAAALLVVLPALSAFGSGVFAWTMYSATGEYRIDIRVKDHAGTWHTVAPTGLADGSSEGPSRILVGADHFRRGPALGALRAHLGELARFACSARHAVESDVVLVERREPGDVERKTSTHVECR